MDYVYVSGVLKTSPPRFSDLLEGLIKTQHIVILQTIIYYTERRHVEISRGKKASGTESGGN